MDRRNPDMWPYAPGRGVDADWYRVDMPGTPTANTPANSRRRRAGPRQWPRPWSTSRARRHGGRQHGARR